MQTSVEGSVDPPSHTQLTYQFSNGEQNKIGAEGCNHLSQGQWTNLRSLDLGTNCDTQGTTMLELKDVASF